MLINIKGLSIVVAMTLGTSAAAAKSMIYDCAPSSGADNSIIQTHILIVHDPETGEAMVNDGVVMHVYDGPIKATVAAESADWVTFKWHIERLQLGSTTANLDYRVKVHKPDGKLAFSVEAASFSNQIDDVGHCTEKAAKLGKKKAKK